MLMQRPASASSMMIPRELLRYRSESLSIEPRLNIYSTSGMTYESVLVVGHMVGSDNVVYYLLEVRSWENPLEGYVVRRRYNDFKKLHSELSEFMPTSKPRSNSSTTGGLLYHSLLCNPLGRSSSSSRSSPELNPLWSPKRPDDNVTSFTTAATRKQSRGSSGDDLDMPHPLGPDDDALALATTRYSVPSKPATPGITYYDTNLALPLDGVKFNMAGRAQLPDMPSGGVASIFSTQQMLIKYRVEQFNRILAAVMSDTSKDVANVLMNFIQEKPGGQATSYTSLSEYAAIDMPLRVERYARRRAMSMGRRPPLLLRDTSGGNASVSTASTSSTPLSLLRSSTAS
uniref:PX domain-containing protein n=1 Tax=Globisporangium ultimum (strain ATCC 200006 / CBS 805.95 / DAOM BR144) TaxID=431595 RepID=K3XBZ6_GLOUD